MPEQRKIDQQKPNKKQSDVGPGEGCSKELVQKRIEAYRIPERTGCLNCRGNYHHSFTQEVGELIVPVDGNNRPFAKVDVMGIQVIGLFDCGA